MQLRTEPHLHPYTGAFSWLPGDNFQGFSLAKKSFRVGCSLPFLCSGPIDTFNFVLQFRPLYSTSCFCLLLFCANCCCLSLAQDFSTLYCCHFGAREFFAVRAALCVTGCWQHPWPLCAEGTQQHLPQVMTTKNVSGHCQMCLRRRNYSHLTTTGLGSRHPLVQWLQWLPDVSVSHPTPSYGSRSPCPEMPMASLSCPLRTTLHGFLLHNIPGPVLVCFSGAAMIWSVLAFSAHLSSLLTSLCTPAS